MSELRLEKNSRTKVELTKKGRFFDYTMLIIVIFLCVFGLVMVYSTSSYTAAIKNGDAAYYFKKQLFSTCVGLVALFAASFIDYHFWNKIKWFIYFSSLVLVLLVLSPIGVELNNARRWIHIGPLSFQPVEYVKIALIITLASFILYSGKKMKNARNNIAYLIITAIPAAMIYFITNNLSSAIILVGIAYVMLMIGNNKPTWLIVATIAGVLLIAVFLIVFFRTVESTDRFRFERLLAWRNPKKYASGVGLQTIQSLYAIGSGGLFGKGLGQSIQKLGFLPEAQNDMIFAIICEEMGLFGGICVILLFMLLIWRFMVIANNAPDLFGSLIVVGVMAHIALQVILNIAVATNTIPNTGISLPFISYGGTSVVFLMAEMGLVLNVSRQIQVPVAVGK